MKYYVLEVYGDIEPKIWGPYATPERRDTKALALRKADEAGENGIYMLNVRETDAKPFVAAYQSRYLNPWNCDHMPECEDEDECKFVTAEFAKLEANHA